MISMSLLKRNISSESSELSLARECGSSDKHVDCLGGGEESNGHSCGIYIFLDKYMINKKSYFRHYRCPSHRIQIVFILYQISARNVDND